MGKRDAPHFITEYYTERGKVELMIPTDATDDDFSLLRDMLDLIEAKFKRRADLKTEPQNLVKTSSISQDSHEIAKDEPQTECPFDDAIPCEWVNCPNSTDCPYKPKDEPQTERSE
jgi:hypothetical protein